MLSFIKYRALLFLFLFTSTLLQAQESAEVMPLAAQSLILSAAKVGPDLVAVGERGHVLKSSDKGQTWRQIADVPVKILLTKVVAVNQSLWAVGHDSTIIHSRDGGETWQLQFYEPEREVPFLSAYFVDEQVGYVAGAYGSILTTDDGGKNWQDDVIHAELDYHLNDITMAQDGTLYIAGEAGNAFISSDQGESWEAVELPYPGSMFGVLALDNEVIMFGLRGHVLSTVDKGVTWQSIKNPNLSSLFGGARLTADSAILVGANGARVIYENQSLRPLIGSSTLELGDDYGGVLVLDNGQNILLLGEEGSDIQALK